MAEAAGEDSLKEIKEAFNEVIDLLNQPNLPVVVKEDGKLERDPSTTSD